VTFRDRLISTLTAIRPILEEDGVLVVGSQVPNLLEPGVASTLVVSQDVDIGIPVSVHKNVKARLKGIQGLQPSREEPSIWVPESEALIEVNFVGMDASVKSPDEAYVLEDDELPLLVFGALSLLKPGTHIEAEGLRIPVPGVSGLMVEKLLTERTGEKGARDLLVALGLLFFFSEADVNETVLLCRSLSPEFRHAVRSNLAILSLMEPVPGMPDPAPHRERIAHLLRRLEAAEVAGK
jgi:hypothetical protein